MKTTKITLALFTLMLAMPAWAQKVPKKSDVENAGKKPYSRYSVPAGELTWVSNSIFQLPSYGNAKDEIDALPRGIAKDLDLTGKCVYNEYPDQVAIKVCLSENAIVLYVKRIDGIIIPIYLADCTYKGKPWFNRLRLVDEPPLLVTPAPTPTPQTL